MNLTCVICGFVGEGGLGHWACHADEDVTPVCRGPCFRQYQTRKAALATLGGGSAAEEFGDWTNVAVQALQRGYDLHWKKA